MDNVMIDIETLSLEENATIVSIGAVLFDTFEIGDEFYEVCELDQHRDLNVGTIAWWMKQDDGARDVFNQHGVPLRYALELLSHFCKRRGIMNVWAKAPDFDCCVLKNACDRLGVAWPFKFYQYRDVRTIEKMLPEGIFNRNELAHNAIADCYAQIEIVQVMMRLMQSHGHEATQILYPEPPPWQDTHITKEYTTYDEGGAELCTYKSREDARAALTEYAKMMDVKLGNGSEGVWDGEGEQPTVVDGRIKHDWVKQGAGLCGGSYICSKCYAVHLEESDASESKRPEYGCCVVPVSDTNHIDKFQHSDRGQVFRAAIDKVEYAGTPDHKEPPADVKEKIAESEGFIKVESFSWHDAHIVRDVNNYIIYDLWGNAIDTLASYDAACIALTNYVDGLKVLLVTDKGSPTLEATLKEYLSVSTSVTKDDRELDEKAEPVLDGDNSDEVLEGD